MKKLIYSIFFFILLSPIIALAQSNLVDSLKLVLKDCKHDTARCRVIASLIEVAPDGEWEQYNQQLTDLTELNLKKYPKPNPLNKVFKKYKAFSLVNTGVTLKMQGKVSDALICFENSLKLQKEIENKEGIAYALGGIGATYQDLGKTDKALSYHLQAADMQKQIKDERGLTYTLIYIAQAYRDNGDLKKALDYYNESLNISERIGNKQGIAFATNDLGVIYESQDEVTNALECFLKSYKLQEELGDKVGMAISLLNVGDVYSQKKDYKKALDYLYKGLKLNEEIGNLHGIAIAQSNLALGYQTIKQLDSAQNCYQKALNIYTEIEETSGIINAGLGLGRIYFMKGDYDKARAQGEKALPLSRQLGFPLQISVSALLLKDVYRKQNNTVKALEMFDLYLIMRDSVSNQNTKRASIKNQLEYEYDKKVIADSLKTAEERKISELKLKQEEKQRYFLYCGLSITLIFGGFMFNRFRITRKQKKVIEQQKALVDEKQKEIIDSIHYAKRIQQSLMPNAKHIEKTINKLKE